MLRKCLTVFVYQGSSMTEIPAIKKAPIIILTKEWKAFCFPAQSTDSFGQKVLKPKFGSQNFPKSGL